MTDREHSDPLLAALRRLPLDDLEPARSRAALARATRVLARRRRAAERWTAIFAAPYARLIEPVGATVLATGFLAAVVVQVAAVFTEAHAGLPW